MRTEGKYTAAAWPAIRFLLVLWVVAFASMPGSRILGQTTTRQAVPLKSGWNLVSFRVAPDARTFPTLLKDNPGVSLVKDANGRIYSPEFGIDQLSPLDSTKAYLVHSRAADSIVVNGRPLVPNNVPIALNKGWNMIPYLSAQPDLVGQALTSILGQTVLVKNTAGQIFSPADNINTIGSLKPGEGYQVFVSAATTLRYSGGGTVPPPTEPPPTEPVPVACMNTPGANLVSKYGSWIPNLTDAATRKANALTLNTALATVGKAGGGTVCMPAGHYYLEPADLTRLITATVYIEHDNITLRGAGKFGDQGGTVLHTRSDWSLINGEVMRGTGIKIKGTRPPQAPRRNITLRDFELDGGAGYTGNFSWPASPRTGDGWDVTHKGIILSADDVVDDVVLENLYVHSYKGEVIYAGGSGLGDLLIRNIKVEDTNASNFNFTARFIVEDSEFGKSSIWFEVGAHFLDKSGIIRNSYFHDAARFGLNFAQGDMNPQSFLVEGNTFERCGKQALFFGGGVAGPVTVRNNDFKECTAIYTGYGGAGGKDNRGILFENNTVKSTQKGMETIYFTSVGTNITVRNNKMEAPRSVSFCCSNLNNVVVEDNEFIGLPPIQHGIPTSGERPIFRRNTYTAPLWYAPISAETKYTPIYEIASVRASVANVVIQLETTYYGDNHVVEFVGGSATMPVKFAKGAASYEVAADRFLTGSNSIWMRFNKAKGKWVEFTP